ncbi:MAG: phosphatase PAP2 family protein [Verrucomicrobia bacterium]|nr:phosphatase PAP2 family protein [Verrucomicrobiota bacterium]
MKHDKTNRSRPPVLLPVLITLLLTLLAWLTRIDFVAADLFFNGNAGRWFLKSDLIVKLIYELTPIPAFIIFGVSVMIVLGSIWKKTWRRFVRQALCWILVMALGPGLVVNSIFKDWYGRPRPKQIVEYGGKMEFCPVWVVGEPGEAKSFPCGHASVGFYFMAGYFCWWRRNHRRALFWLITGLAAGIVLGLARMACGAHWFSDVVWAGTFVYFISYGVAWGCGLLKDQTENIV